MSTHRQAFFQHLYRNRCKFTEDLEEVESIGDGIQLMVWNILCELGKRNPVFQISKMIPCGSYFEETKVGSPDEFDFMVVLANLSQKNSIELIKGCSVWYPKVKVLRYNDKYRKYLASNSLDEESKQYLGKPSQMSNDFWKELSNIIDNECISQTNTYGTIKVEKSPGMNVQKLQFKYTKPAKPIKPATDDHLGLVHLETISIGVDLMLAIEVPETETILTNPNFPSAFSSYVKEHGCYVIAKSCHGDHFPDPSCWSISFAACELEIMKRMTETHKRAYKILKYLLIGEINFPGKCMNLSSYMLKTALMFHVHGEEKCSNPSNYSTCIDAILKYLKSGFYYISMPRFFARDIDVWGHLVEVPCFHWSLDLSKEEEQIGQGPIYSLLWLKFWYNAVEACEVLLTNEACRDKNDWILTDDRFKVYRESVWFLLEKYYISAKVYKSQLKMKQIKVDHLNSMISAIFARYMNRMHEEYKMKIDII